MRGVQNHLDDIFGVSGTVGLGSPTVRLISIATEFGIEKRLACNMTFPSMKSKSSTGRPSYSQKKQPCPIIQVSPTP